MEWNLFLCYKKQKYDPWGRKKDSNPYLKGYKLIIKNKFINKILKILKTINEYFQKKNQSFQSKKKNNVNVLFSIILFCVLTWFLTGFCIIKKNEQGVLLRFGQYQYMLNSGLHWKINFIEEIIPINIKRIYIKNVKSNILTSDQNIIHINMDIQYKIVNPIFYLFNIQKPDYSLFQATNSILTTAFGQINIEDILNINQKIIKEKIKKELKDIISLYEIGINILDINFQEIIPPITVKKYFDDVIIAHTEKKNIISEAKSYYDEVVSVSKGNAKKIIEEANAYKVNLIAKAKGEIAGFSKILPEYNLSPQITRERLYIETMERILENSRKIFVTNKDNIIVLSMDSSNLNNIQNKNLDLSKKDELNHQKNKNIINQKKDPEWIYPSRGKNARTNDNTNRIGR
ncbi:MAG: FtsH protease activity modulator HflK [Arsenophonus sp.]|nr:MAG: FtsH protease activity modulator HflK [Arsenophonus sp.]